MKASQRRNHLLACACLAVIALGAPSRAFAADTPYDVINRAAANSLRSQLFTALVYRGV